MISLWQLEGEPLDKVQNTTTDKTAKTHQFSLAYTRIAYLLSIIVLGLYIVAVLFPAYWSGIAHMSANDIYTYAPAVPFYEPSGFASQSGLLLLPVLVVLSAWYGLPALFAGVVIARSKELMSTASVQMWLAFGLIAGLLYLTAPAAQALLTYIMD